MQECPLGLSLVKYHFSTLRMVRKVSGIQCVALPLFHDAYVCALSIGTHASECRIGPDWSDPLLYCSSRRVLSVNTTRTKARLAAIESVANVGIV